ncbi:MAG: DUF393 domain-containing protein [Bacteroidetes bacterium]|nr:MAG: DUF393 domain-containing protein [Bacteroidota bacterium]
MKKILYDDTCELCNNSIRFIAQHGGADKFQFVPLQSEEGGRELKRHGLPEDYTGSVLLAGEDGLHSKSDAVLRILHELDGPWSMLYRLRRIPRPIRDFFYNIVSRIRHTRPVQRMMKK